MSRRNGRVLAFQGLYSWEVSKNPIDEILSFDWAENPEDTESTTFASYIISGAIDHMEEIDAKISEFLNTSWTIERINKVSLSILRSSTYELLFQSDTEPKIVIDEAVEIAKKYGEDGSFKFINAVLDKISKSR